MSTTRKPKVNVVVAVESYDGNDTWLEVGGDHLKEEGVMYAVITVYEDGATSDWGYSSKKEAKASCDPGVPIVYTD